MSGCRTKVRRSDMVWLIWHGGGRKEGWREMGGGATGKNAVPDEVRDFEPVEDFTGADKRKTNGVVFDMDGAMRGIVQLETAKATAKGVKVKGFAMLEDGKKASMKSVTVPIEDGRLLVRTSVGKLGEISLVVGGDGFVGEFAGMRVVSADLGEDSGVLSGSLTLKHFDASGKLKNRKIAIGGVVTGGTAAGTATAKGAAPRAFAAELE